MTALYTTNRCTVVLKYASKVLNHNLMMLVKAEVHIITDHYFRHTYRSLDLVHPLKMFQ